jgi:hypothetical protein
MPLRSLGESEFRVILEVWFIRSQPHAAPGQSELLSQLTDLIPVPAIPDGFAVMERRYIKGEPETMPRLAWLGSGDYLSGFSSALGVEVCLLSECAQRARDTKLNAFGFAKFNELPSFLSDNRVEVVERARGHLRFLRTQRACRCP